MLRALPTIVGRPSGVPNFGQRATAGQGTVMTFQPDLSPFVAVLDPKKPEQHHGHGYSGEADANQADDDRLR